MKTTLQTLEIPLPDGNKEVLDVRDFATTSDVTNAITNITNITNAIVNRPSVYPIIPYDRNHPAALRPNNYYKSVGDYEIRFPILFIPSPIDTNFIINEVKKIVPLIKDFIFSQVDYIFAPFDWAKYYNNGFSYNEIEDLMIQTSCPCVYIKANSPNNSTLFYNALFRLTAGGLLLVCYAYDVNLLNPHDNDLMTLATLQVDVPIYISANRYTDDTLDVLTFSWSGYGEFSANYYGKCLLFEEIEPITQTDPFTQKDLVFKYKIVGYFPHADWKYGKSDAYTIFSTGCEEGAILAIPTRYNVDYGCISALNYNYKKSSNKTAEYILDGVFYKHATFDAPIQWNNDIPPAFDNQARFVISVLDGVGCFTQSLNNY